MLIIGALLLQAGATADEVAATLHRCGVKGLRYSASFNNPVVRFLYRSLDIGGRLEIGHRFEVARYGVTPFGILEGSNLWQNGYAETSTTENGNAGILGLTYQAQTIGSLPTTLGVQFDRTIKSADGTVWAPFLRLGWQHEFMTTREVNAALTAPVGKDRSGASRVAGAACQPPAWIMMCAPRAKAVFRF